jgi:hypothetical protein
VKLTLHSTDHQLELYSLNRLPDSDAPLVEEHLLACDSCRERLDLVEHFVVGLKTELKRNPAPVSAWAWPKWLSAPFSQSAFGAMACVAAVALVYFAMPRTTLIPAASLQLTAMRGDMPSTAQAREVDLTLADTPPAGDPFTAELVDASGKALWSGSVSRSAAGEEKSVELKIRQSLAPGGYFVRLSNSAHEVVHEYGFRVSQ